MKKDLMKQCKQGWEIIYDIRKTYQSTENDVMQEVRPRKQLAEFVYASTQTKKSMKTDFIIHATAHKSKQRDSRDISLAAKRRLSKQAFSSSLIQ